MSTEVERSLVLLKPDAIQRGVAMEILGRFERRGLRTVALKLVQISDELARRHYAVHQDQFFYDDLVRHITTGPVIATVLEGPACIGVVRSMVGATLPHEAEPGTIRGDLALTPLRNLVHASDSTETAAAEIDLYFDAGEMLDYERRLDEWIHEA